MDNTSKYRESPQKALGPLCDELLTPTPLTLLKVFVGNNWNGAYSEHRWLNGPGSALIIDNERLREFDKYAWPVYDRNVLLVGAKDIPPKLLDKLAHDLLKEGADVIAFNGVEGPEMLTKGLPSGGKPKSEQLSEAGISTSSA